ncbi:MAG: hypothetical protein RID81_06890 [Sandaracinaceae bacterium]
MTEGPPAKGFTARIGERGEILHECPTCREKRDPEGHRVLRAYLADAQRQRGYPTGEVERPKRDASGVHKRPESNVLPLFGGRS